MITRLTTVLVATAVCGCFASAPADAEQSKFGGFVSNSCTLSTINDGILVSDVPGRVLDSSVPGGRPSRVKALTTSRGFKVRTFAPTVFTLGNSANTTFASLYSISGSTSATNIPGTTPSNLNPGSNVIAVNLRAVRTAGVFPRGNYEAVVIVRCE